VTGWRTWSDADVVAEQDRQELAETERHLSELLKRLDSAQIGAPNRQQSEAVSASTAVSREKGLRRRFTAPHIENVRGLLKAIDAQISRIDKALRRGIDWLTPSRRAPPHQERPEVAWTPGSVITRIETRPIWHGYVQVCEEVPIGPISTESTLSFLLTIPGIRDVLMRENHGWGYHYHYHYCNQKRDRSDTILCFDVGPPVVLKPLFSEGHAEAKAKFKARAGDWKAKKRCSVYSVCAPDLSKRPNGPFKCPEKDAALIWP
jgi:hypothetical protein